MKRAIVFFYLFCAPACAVSAPVPAASPTQVSQQEQNKAVARRVFEEIFNQGKFQVADEIYAKDFVNHGSHGDANLATDQAAVRFEKQACPDLTLAFGPMVAEGDLVSVLWTARGTNTARVGWMPATGAAIEVRGITIWRISAGQFREEWSSFNEFSIIREVAYQLRWKLAGLACVGLLLLWFLVKIAGQTLFGRRTS